jgi:Na+/H+ antiporter NhaD/arsenite permease-like protein
LILYFAHDPEALVHTGRDYLSFMILLGSLFVISGGVFMDGDLEATPLVNTLFLALGAAVASVVGTTGASMLLIRPLLHTNAERRYVVHTVVFFIFLVSNIGGSLTPLGDPPLFLGYLAGVPFTWTIRLAPVWTFTTVLLLAIYFIWDTRVHKKEPPERLALDATKIKPLRVVGKENLVLLAGIVAAAAFLSAPWREIAMVAVVFLGIFATMIPALNLLRARGAELGVNHAWQYFWATGALSSFLDNAPTYLTFLALGQGQNLTPEVVGVPHRILEAISVGAVFMGANSYIGNGPNFMVRSIAESRGIKMPSFGGYMLYSGAILIPVFVLVTLVFFRG